MLHDDNLPFLNSTPFPLFSASSALYSVVQLIMMQMTVSTKSFMFLQCAQSTRQIALYVAANH